MEIRGGAAALWTHQDDQTVVLEGGVATGKTHGWETFALWFAEEFPGSRILFLRKIRADLIESTLIKPWESTIIDKHLRMGVITVEGGAKRTKYVHQNGSVFVPGGLDKSSRLMGGQWDLVIFCEATEATEDDYEDLLTRTSREAGVAPYSFIILDVNPASASHWINQKAEAGHIKRLLSRHEDNPILFDVVRFDESGAAVEFAPTEQGRKYMSKLDQLTGARKERLKFHRWATSEGLIWPEYDASIHRIGREGFLDRMKFKKLIGGFDWGHNDPGSLTIWGVDERTNQSYLVYQVYRRHQNMNWWAERMLDLYDICGNQFGLPISKIVVSHEQPSMTDIANDLFQRAGKRRICSRYRAKPGCVAKRNELVRWFWQPSASIEVEERPTHSAPMAFVLSGSLIFKPDDEDELGLRPVGLEQEIPGYVWAPTPDGRRSKEEPDPGCPNHACDSAGMALEEIFKMIRRGMSEGLNEEPDVGSMERSRLEEQRLLGLAPPSLDEYRRKRRNG